MYFNLYFTITNNVYTQDIFINAFTFESVENTNTMKNKKYHTVTSEQFQNPIKTSQEESKLISLTNT